MDFEWSVYLRRLVLVPSQFKKTVADPIYSSLTQSEFLHIAEYVQLTA